ncbi:hypothetical protein EKO27_g1375 [Xylaria grammica]|uniref:Rhodopsin domain-containing protein n=1 Tax=Xylaria grammica TaxID=363999 RepID=A0A439DH70_9PEZI|nr:hypothetical protein EKO27_g1375 [Xylaria grammica]
MAESNVLAMTVTMIVLSIVSFGFMLLRFYSKYLTRAMLGLDDIVLALSWTLHLVFVIISIISTRYGLGSHLDDIDLTLLPRLLKLLPIAQFFAVISVAVSKSSFILTLLRLVQKGWQKAVLWFMLATVNGSLLSISIVQFFQCSEPPTPGCVPGNQVIALGVFAAAYSAAVDLVLVVFPSLVIWSLQMRQREKLGIIISMSLGVVAGVVGIYKSTTIPNVSRSVDFAYGTAIVLIWLVAEVCSTIIAASIPFYRPLLRHVASRTGKSGTESYALGSRRRDGHSRIGSQTDLKSGIEFDDNSDKGILGAPSRIVRKTNITVEYENHDQARRAGQRQGHRDVF